MKVVHKSFGEGVIRVKRSEPGYIFVMFPSGGEIQFRIPDAFKNDFLWLEK